MQFLVDPSRVTLGPAAWAFLLVVGLLLPVAAVRQHGRLAAGNARLPSRLRVYGSAIATHLLLVLLSGTLLRGMGLGVLRAYRPTAVHVAIGLVAFATGLVPLLTRFRPNDPVARERVRLIAPRSDREFAMFYGVSVSAGIAEELTYRGAMFTLLTPLLPGWWMPALVAAAVFGIVHLFQGWKSAGIAGLIGLRDQVVVGLTGTLFVAIVVHTLHDVITGTVIGLRARRDDLAPTPQPA